jgi:hypothetical protein
LKRSARSMLWSRNNSDVIAGMFMAIVEGELGDAGFVEIPDAFIDEHSAWSRYAREFSMSAFSNPRCTAS